MTNVFDLRLRYPVSEYLNSLINAAASILNSSVRKVSLESKKSALNAEYALYANSQSLKGNVYNIIKTIRVKKLRVLKCIIQTLNNQVRPIQINSTNLIGFLCTMDSFESGMVSSPLESPTSRSDQSEDAAPDILQLVLYSSHLSDLAFRQAKSLTTR